MSDAAKSNVESLFGHPLPTGEPDPTLIEMLEDYLERAKSGEIIAMHGIVTYRDDAVAQCGAGTYPIRKVLGALEIMKAGMISGFNDD